MTRQTFIAGERIKQGEEVWELSGMPGGWLKPKVRLQGDRSVGRALETAEKGGLVVVELQQGGK